MSHFLISAPRVESYQDAVSQLKELAEKDRLYVSQIRQTGRELIRNRFSMGQLTDMGLTLTNAGVDDLAALVGVGSKVLYDAHLVFRRFRSRLGLEQEIRRWEEEEGEDRITWTRVLNHARKRLPDDAEKARSKLSQEAKRLENRARALEADAVAMEREAERMNGFAEAEELNGVAVHAKIVAEDTWRQAQVLKTADPKPERIRDEKYLAYIREQPCLQCGTDALIQPHHLDRGGTGTKGSDYFATPLCSECHGLLHQVGDSKFWGNINPWKYVAELMQSYFLR